HASFLDMVRRWEVRLAGPKVGNVDAFSLHLFRFGEDGGGRRDLNSVDTVSQLHLKLLRQWTRSTGNSLQARRFRANTELACWECDGPSEGLGLRHHVDCPAT